VRIKPSISLDQVPRLALHYGAARTPLVWIIPDETYPGMYRLRWPDGRTSDMGNLTRAKDAAETICAADRDPKLFRWDRSDVRSGARRRVFPPAPSSTPIPNSVTPPTRHSENRSSGQRRTGSFQVG